MSLVKAEKYLQGKYLAGEAVIVKRVGFRKTQHFSVVCPRNGISGAPRLKSPLLKVTRRAKAR